jgi:enoyl-CoA hydratase
MTTDKPEAPSTIEIERLHDDGVAIVRLNRPDRLNALNLQMTGELHHAFLSLEADRGVRAIVLTGSGERAFCAGADIGEFQRLHTALEGAAMARHGQRLTLLMEELGTPVIAAINGFALGGGMELAMGTDIRIAGENAKFGQPEVGLGLMPGFGGSQRTARLLGRGAAMQLCLTGETIDAQTALRIGLVQAVVPPAGLLDEALRIAKLIAAKAPLAIAATKHAIDEGLKHGDTAVGLEIEALHFGSLINTEDFREGVRAFLEKRPAKFEGH